MRTDAELAKVAYLAWATQYGLSSHAAAVEWGEASGLTHARWGTIAAAVRLAVVNDLTADLGAALNPGRERAHADGGEGHG